MHGLRFGGQKVPYIPLYTSKIDTLLTHTPQKPEANAKNRRSKRIPMYNDRKLFETP